MSRSNQTTALASTDIKHNFRSLIVGAVSACLLSLSPLSLAGSDLFDAVVKLGSSLEKVSQQNQRLGKQLKDVEKDIMGTWAIVPDGYNISQYSRKQGALERQCGFGKPDFQFLSNGDVYRGGKAGSQPFIGAKYSIVNGRLKLVAIVEDAEGFAESTTVSDMTIYQYPNPVKLKQGKRASFKVAKIGNAGEETMMLVDCSVFEASNSHFSNVEGKRYRHFSVGITDDQASIISVQLCESNRLEKTEIGNHYIGVQGCYGEEGIDLTLVAEDKGNRNFRITEVRLQQSEQLDKLLASENRQGKKQKVRQTQESNRRQTKLASKGGYKDFHFGHTLEEIEKMGICQQMGPISVFYHLGASCYKVSGKQRNIGFHFDSDFKLVELNVFMGDYEKARLNQIRNSLKKKYTESYAPSKEELNNFRYKRLDRVMYVYDEGKITLQLRNVNRAPSIISVDYYNQDRAQLIAGQFTKETFESDDF